MDGVDLAHCTFEIKANGYNYVIGRCETYAYPADWLKRLKQLPSATAEEYAFTHVEYGRYLGGLVNQFTLKYSVKADFVSSHGHTIFHQPNKGFTAQIGDGASLAAECGLPVVCDFRSSDVAYHGQGAPLVPIGDDLLFPEFTYCLNLGGFANISFRSEDSRLAYDICPANIILNHLANKTGVSFDEDGRMAEQGKVDAELLDSLNKLPYYSMPYPKSLGREWLEKDFLPLFDSSSCNTGDLMRTAVEHIVLQILRSTSHGGPSNILVTGGGALNKYLISRLQASTDHSIVVPSRTLVEYKEALIFAFLGLHRMLNKPNSLKSVTGASKDACGGAVYLP